MNNRLNMRRPAVVLALLLLAGLLLSACGGSSTSTSQGGTSASTTAATAGQSTSATPTSTSPPASTGNARAIEVRLAAFRGCMKKHGVALPVTKIGEKFKRPAGISDARYEAAASKCKVQLGSSEPAAKPLPPATTAQRQALARFSECLRQNGVNIPAPTKRAPLFYPKSLNLNSPQFKAAQTKCVPTLIKASKKLIKPSKKP